MGSCCGKKKRVLRRHELAFMGIIQEGCYQKPEVLDEILRNAKEEG